MAHLFKPMTHNSKTLYWKMIVCLTQRDICLYSKNYVLAKSDFLQPIVMQGLGKLSYGATLVSLAVNGAT